MLFLQISNYNPSCNSSRLFVAIDKPILKVTWKFKRSRISKTVLKKKKTHSVRRLTLSHFKTHYKSTVIKTMWYWHRVQINEWTTASRPALLPVIWFSTREPMKSSGERKTFSSNSPEITVYPYEKMNLTPILHHNQILRWIVILNRKTKTIKFLQKNRRTSLWLGSRQNFLGHTKQ